MVREIVNPEFENNKLELSACDFNSMDTDNDQSLSLVELEQGSKSERFKDSETKQGAINFLADHLRENAPQGSLPYWYGEEFAKGKIQDEQFRLIDADGDDVLSKKELNNADQIDKLSPLQKHAARILGNKLDLAESDPLSDGKNGIENWNPKSIEPCSKHMEQVQDRLDNTAEEIARRISCRNGRDAYQALGRSYVKLQDMWQDASRINGNPMRTMETALNKAFEGSGNTVRVMDPMSEYIPKYPWSRRVDAVVSLNPRQHNADDTTRQTMYKNMGAGIYGLHKR